MTKRADWLHLGRHRDVQGPRNRVVERGGGGDARKGVTGTVTSEREKVLKEHTTANTDLWITEG